MSDDTKYPICPMGMYFEGDEDKVNLKACDWDDGECSEKCKREFYNLKDDAEIKTVKLEMTKNRFKVQLVDSDKKEREVMVDITNGSWNFEPSSLPEAIKKEIKEDLRSNFWRCLS